MAVDFLNAVKSPVYYKIGKHKNEQRDRFCKAPFDLLKLSGVTYVSPSGSHGTLAKEFQDILNGTLGDNTEKVYETRFGGWIDESVVIEPHEMGDLKDENWKSLHCFGLL